VTSESMNNNRADLAVPFLPRLVLIMSVPLYFGYLIKHGLVPEGAVFAFAYSWAVTSVVVVPVLCVVEGWYLVRMWIGGRPQGSHALRWHATGLGIGIGALLAVLVVR
jgi:hypothetical protein